MPKRSRNSANSPASMSLPPAFCEPVFLLNEAPRGCHLHRAEELNVPVVVLLTVEHFGGFERLIEWRSTHIPLHPTICWDHLPDSSLLVPMKNKWRRLVRRRKLEALNTIFGSAGDPSQHEPEGDDVYICWSANWDQLR